jgi:hypothetical protein
VVLEIDGEIKRFRYEHPWKSGLPSARKTMYAAVLKMQTPEDFENLPNLFTGVSIVAGRKLEHSDYVTIVRRAGMHGCIDVIMRMTMRAKQWGLKLDRPEVVSELLAWLQMPALESEWAKEQTEKALKDVERVLDMFEDEKHMSPKTAVHELRSLSFKRDPLFLGPRLHMAAAMAVKHNDGKDIDGKVEKYARQIISIWPAGTGLTALHPEPAYRAKTELKFLEDGNNYAFHTSPILHGLRLAAQVVDETLAKELEARAKALEGELETALSVKPRHQQAGRGQYIYDKLFNSQP